MKNIKNTLIFLILVSVSITNNVKAQGVDDFGVIWKKSFGTGVIHNITPNNTTDANDKGYIACGYSATYTGLIIEFDEIGNEIRKTTYTPPTSIYASSGISNSFRFRAAFKTNDGGILAFGDIMDYGATEAEIHSRIYGLLSNGIVIVKFDKNLNVVKQQRVRGARAIQGVQISDRNFLIAGFDTNVKESNANITLLRKYDQNGNLLVDKRSDYLEIVSILKYEGSDTFLAHTTNRVLKIDATPTAGNPHQLAITSTMLITGRPGMSEIIYPYMQNATPSSDGGILFSTTLNSNANATQNWTNGRGFFRLNKNNDLVYKKINKPFDEYFHAPLLLPGNLSTYIGMYYKLKTANGSTPPSDTNPHIPYIYQLIDDGTFNTKIGMELPLGVSLKTTSRTDGFFLAGGNTTDGAIIMKLSTCATFKVTTLPEDHIILKPYNPMINLFLPIEYEGAIGEIDYFWKAIVKSGIVNGKQAGEEVGTDSGIAGDSPSGLAVQINENYSLSTESAIIEYTLVLKDSYITAGVPQSCAQSYIFRVVTAPQTAVIAMPLLKTEGTSNKVIAAIKNIGLAPFSNYKVTIYKDNVGNATKQTYTYSSTIVPNGTAHLEIELDPSLVGVSQLFVKFNDDGTGSQSQLELSNEQTEYEVDVE